MAKMSKKEFLELFKNKCPEKGIGTGKGRISNSNVVRYRPGECRKGVKTEEQKSFFVDPSRPEIKIDRYKTENPLAQEEFILDVMFYTVHMKDEKKARELIRSMIHELKGSNKLRNGMITYNCVKWVNGVPEHEEVMVEVEALKLTSAIYRKIIRQNAWKYADNWK